MSAAGLLEKIFTEAKNAWLRRKRHRALWQAVDAEIDIVRDRAEGFLAANVMAPLYRFPDSSFKTCYPQLLADGAIPRDEVTVLGLFQSEVETLNRGFEQAARWPDNAPDFARNTGVTE